MTEKRIQFNNIIQNQLPNYVKEEFPLVAEFLKQYYISQEYTGSATDLLQNIDEYIKLDNIKSNSRYTTLVSDISFSDENISVDNTNGFPDSYGLLKIDDEVITYLEKNDNKLEDVCLIPINSTIIYYEGLPQEYIGRELLFNDALTDDDGKQIQNIIVVSVSDSYFEVSDIPIQSENIIGYNENNLYQFQIYNPQFVGCIRGFSGVTSYKKENKPEELVFNATESDSHTDGSKVINLSSLFLEEFLNKIKYQLSPGFENREFYSGLDKYLFLKQSKDFYSTRGTDLSFKILFKILYGEDVKVIKPQDYLIKPSDAQYNITNDLVVESISGDPYELLNSTLFQDEYGDIPKGYAQISKVEKIFSDTGKDYYKLSFDAGYNKDIRVDGSLYGTFSIHPKTKVIGDVPENSDTIDVDSTVGFPTKGELYVKYSNGSEGIITYTSKNNNQFFGCENIEFLIENYNEIYLNTYAYGSSNKNTGDIIKVRIGPVLSDVTILDDTFYHQKGNIGIIKTLGINDNSVVSNNWILNISKNITVESIFLLTGDTYELECKYDHNLFVGDNITIKSSDSITYNSKVSKVVSERIVQISGQGFLNVDRYYTIRRNLRKVSSDLYPYLNNQIADVQNIYTNSEDVLISSSCLPYYNNQNLNFYNKILNFTGVFSYDTFTFDNIIDHGFYTGDAIYYLPDVNDPEENILEEGVYYVARINSSGIVGNVGNSNKIKLSKSRALLFNAIRSDSTDSGFVYHNGIKQISNGKIIDFDFFNIKDKTIKKISSQKLLRKIKSPYNDGNRYVTQPGPTGILINGVEILNYKSKDKVFYGPIEDIEIINSGQNYDIINPPELIITDQIGIGATGYCAVKGTLRGINIIDPGFDYIETPKINISGGNGFGAVALPVMKIIDHKVPFYSDEKSLRIDLINDTIGFSTYHKFRDHERVIYKTEGQLPVGGLSNNSSYYVKIIDNYHIKLHSNYDDSIVGINTISLNSYGSGIHILEAYQKKSVLASVNIQNSGQNFENKVRTSTPENVNIYSNEIYIKNHDFKSGEIIKYTTNGSVIGGLVNNNEYYVTSIDSNRFRLSKISDSVDDKDFYYRNNEFIEFNSIGTGTHTFNYPPIEVKIVGKVGFSTNYDIFSAKLQPLFRGQITSIHLKDGGVNYGCQEILNFQRNPTITLNSGFGGSVTPIVNSGRIVDVLVNNPGQGYNSPPNLTIITNGRGRGAVLTPVIENGRIKSVNILESGIGYEKDATFISITPSGIRAEFKPKIKSWTVNLVEKYFNNIKSDDIIPVYNSNSKYDLQLTHLYAPRKLRENINPKGSDGSIIYGKYDLNKDNNGNEISSDVKSHSPIIGWAYDGNPIYGPYGFSKKEGGVVTRLKSGYILKNNLENRPSYGIFANGFFVEDYEYIEVNDDEILDENNGRFCVTPDFPDGVYAYFSTIQEDSSNTFSGYRLPQFPYFIGNTYNSSPIDFNFKRSSNQDDINLNGSDWIRNTNLYGIFDDYESYQYINIPNKLNQSTEIKYASPGSIQNINIISGGDEYKINDNIIFDESETGGYGLATKISRIGGKEVNRISVATTTINNISIYPDDIKNQFIIESQNPHNLSSGDIITLSGLSTEFSLENNFYTIKTIANVLKISDTNGLADATSTGICTYVKVSGNLSNSLIRENDIYSIGNEKIKILSVDKDSSRVKILRSIDGTPSLSHNYGDLLYEKSRKIYINATNVPNTNSFRSNKEIYFDPKESLGIGSLSGVGIGSVITFSNPGVGITQLFIPTRSIYIKNHNLNTGDEVIYSSNGGNQISVLNTSEDIFPYQLQNNSIVYVAKISNDLIGISTVKIGIGTTGSFVGIASTTQSKSILYFADPGSGSYHSFKTTYSNITGKLYKNVVTVSTSQTHSLTNNDVVFIDVKSGISTTVYIKYNDFNRRIIINPRQFLSGDVNISDNTIRIENHNFKNGQKVIYNSNTPSGGLVNNKIYYVIVYDRDTIRLCDNYLLKNSINITSQSDGEILPINPEIKLYKNSKVIFDLSDSSLSYTSGAELYTAFDFNLYLDPYFNEKIEPVKYGIEIYGVPGIDSDARKILTIADDTPTKMFYKLDKVYTVGVSYPQQKNEIIIDNLVNLNNQINIVDSVYSGKYNVISTGASIFTYNLLNVPERNVYTNSNASIIYETTSLSSAGPITKVDITSNGKNYYNLPDFVGVRSNNGKNAILECDSDDIGKIKTLKLLDIGFDFPSDYTLRPNLSLPQILKVDPLNSFESIDIVSFGRGYLTPPKLIVIDSKTKTILPEVDIRYSLGDTSVSILQNTFRLNDVEPIILPTQNSNGVGISSVYFNSLTRNVTVTLSVGYSTSSSFPFSIGDKIMIENISVGINSTGKGFNSKNYNYELFTINEIDPNIGGELGSVTYSLDQYLNANEFPGQYDDENSSGRIIPEKYFPIFKSNLKPNNFIEGESIKYSTNTNSIGIVQNWDERLKYLSISSKYNVLEGEVLEGIFSKTQGKISKVISQNAFINLNSYSKYENGWITDTGILNNQIQKIQDNFYYQNFSYSLKSKVPYDKWENAVGSLNHTAGFKKFSDYQLETYSNPGISTDAISSVDVTLDLDGFASLNCVYDFDLAKENSLFIGDSVISDEITFSSRILTDYFESVGNRVLTIDDFSGLFNSNPRIEQYSVVYSFPLNEYRSNKFITLVRDRRFTSERQTMILTLLHDNSIGYINQYGRVESVLDLGSFDFKVEGENGLILFYPLKYKKNDYDVVLTGYNLKDNFTGIGTTSIGDIVNIESNTISGVNTTTTIVGISTINTSSKILVSIQDNNNEFIFDELNIVHNGSDVEFISYGQLSNHSLDEFSSDGLGQYNVYISGSNVNVDYTPNVGTAVTVSYISVSIANTSYSGVGTFSTNYTKLYTSSTLISSSPNPSPTIISEYSYNYSGGYFIVQVSDISNNTLELSEIVVSNNDNFAYITEYAKLQTYSSLGTVGVGLTNGVVQITYTPIEDIDVDVKVLGNILSHKIVPL